MAICLQGSDGEDVGDERNRNEDEDEGPSQPKRAKNLT